MSTADSSRAGVHDILNKDGYDVAIVANPTLSLVGDNAATRNILDQQTEPLLETDLYTLARYASHLRAIVQAVGGPGTALLGHSHGGSVLQLYITTYPDSVRAIVLVCSTPE